MNVTNRTIEADGNDQLRERQPRLDPLYRIRVTIPATDEEAWVWSRVASEIGLHPANGRVIEFEAVRMSADQVAKLNEEESEIRLRIRNKFGTSISSIDYEVIE